MGENPYRFLIFTKKFIDNLLDICYTVCVFLYVILESEDIYESSIKISWWKVT